MTNQLATTEKCPGCGKDSPEASMCISCETWLDAEAGQQFQSEGPLAPIVDPVVNQIVSPSINPVVDPVVNPFVDPVINPEPTAAQQPFAEPKAAGSWAMTALMVLSVLAALGGVGVGVAMLTQATMGVGLIGGACFLGILTRLMQAGRHHRLLLHSLSHRRHA
jgi:hypothetical protein